MTFEEIVEDFLYEVYSEIDELVLFIEEENPIMPSEIIRKLIKLLEGLDIEYNRHLLKVIKGEEDDT